MRPGQLAAAAMGWLLVLSVVYPASGQDGQASDPKASQENTSIRTEKDYDPFLGMDENGRIPQIDKKGLVDHPERWRYIPEGRLKPGNFLQRFALSSFLVPIVFSNSDVGTGFGAAITDIDFRGRRRREFLGGFFSYTTEGQQSYVLRWRRWTKHKEVAEGGILQEERSFLRAGGGYQKTLTRRFFGIGPSTQEREETSYTDEVAFLDIGLSHSLGDSLRGSFGSLFDDVVLELGLRGEYHWLDDGRVGGAFRTAELFPQLFEEADRYGLGWVGASLRWDTRDSQRNPYRGAALGASVNAALAQNGGQLGATYSLFADKIVTIPSLLHDGGTGEEENPPTDTLAFHLETRLSSGDLPFFARPTLGGSSVLRGFIAGRWRDDASWLAATEYRFWLIPRGFNVWRHIRVERIGAAAFYEVGGVAEDGFAFFRERVRQSYGVSGRLMLERAAVFRADFGFSEEGFQFSAGFGLSF